MSSGKNTGNFIGFVVISSPAIFSLTIVSTIRGSWMGHQKIMQNNLMGYKFYPDPIWKNIVAQSTTLHIYYILYTKVLWYPLQRQPHSTSKISSTIKSAVAAQLVNGRRKTNWCILSPGIRINGGYISQQISWTCQPLHTASISEASVDVSHFLLDGGLSSWVLGNGNRLVFTVSENKLGTEHLQLQHPELKIFGVVEDYHHKHLRNHNVKDKIFRVRSMKNTNDLLHIHFFLNWGAASKSPLSHSAMSFHRLFPARCVEHAGLWNRKEGTGQYTENGQN